MDKWFYLPRAQNKACLFLRSWLLLLERIPDFQRKINAALEKKKQKKKRKKHQQSTLQATFSDSPTYDMCVPRTPFCIDWITK